MASDPPSSQDPKSDGLEPERRRIRNARRKSGMGFAAAVSGILVILFGSFYFVVYGNGDRANSAEYALVIDAGSSGSRIHLYKWLFEDDAPIPLIEEIPLEKGCKKTEPGLSDVQSRDIGKSLGPLIKCARSGLDDRVEDLEKIPLYLMATAGMRLLESENKSGHDDRIERVRAYLEGAPFDFRHASTIDAREEAIYAWVAANYLNGSLGEASEKSTIGILELGGASGQIAFVPQDPKSEDIEVIHISGSKYKVYARGYDGVGKDKVTKAFENEKLCFPRNFEMVRGGVGKGNHDDCRSEIIEYFENTKEPAFRQLREETPPEADGRFVAISNFLFTPNLFGQKYVMDYDELRSAGSKFCSKDWMTILEEYSDQKPEHLRGHCLMAAYIPVLLSKGFGVEDHYGRVRLRLGGSKADVDWTLGALILRIH
jgi:apyrase